MRRMRILTVLMFMAVFATADSGDAQIPQTISYQGVLTDGAGLPVPDGSYAIMFNIYTAASGGSDIWSEIKTVQVAGGIFSVVLGDQSPLTIAFDEQYWLGISVDGGNEYAPRRPFTASAYALNSQTVADSAVTSEKIAAGAVVRSLNALTGDVTLAEGNNVSIATSGDSLIISSTGGGTSLDWSLTGNAGTTAGTDFLGTTDDVALEFHVNAARALRLEPDATSPNIIAGYSGNMVNAGVYGAVIAGAGNAATPNRVRDHYGVVSGGASNTAGHNSPSVDDAMYATVGGGFGNLADAEYATVSGGNTNNADGVGSVIGGGENNDAPGINSVIAGGENNLAGGPTSVVGGGNYNSASGNNSTVAGGNSNFATGESSFIGGGDENNSTSNKSTVAGGHLNTASGDHSAIGGGIGNTASGYSATVPGGGFNNAQAPFSFAAGYRAIIDGLHDGAIVLADSSDFDFGSAAADEFAVRCTGGVRLVTGIDGTGAPTAGATLASGSGAWGTLSDRNAKTNFEPVDADEILARVAGLEITTWNYKAQDASVRHMGPMAQDFHAAFGLGSSDKRITTVDIDGVSLAAIQALNQKLNQKIEARDSQIAGLEKRIAQLEAMVLQVSQANQDGK